MRRTIFAMILVSALFLSEIPETGAFTDWDKDFCSSGTTAFSSDVKGAFKPGTHRLLSKVPLPIKFWVYKNGNKQAAAQCKISIFYKTIVDAVQVPEKTYTEISCNFLKPNLSVKPYRSSSGKLKDKKYASRKATVESDVIFRKKKQDYIISIDLSPGTPGGAMLIEGFSPAIGTPCSARSMSLKVVIDAKEKAGRIKVWKKSHRCSFGENGYFWFTDRGAYEFFFNPTVEYMHVDNDYLRIPPCTKKMVKSSTDTGCYHLPVIP